MELSLDQKEYYHYLKSISWRGKLFRRLLVYPLINSWVNGKVLDVGCGLGLYLESRKDAIGVDINKYCVSHCQKLHLQAELMERDKLPFPNNSRIGTVVLDNVLEHLEEPQKLLSECTRVLPDDGRLIILVPGRKGYSRDADHKIFYQFSSIRKLAVEFGFSVIKERSIPMPWVGSLLSSFCYFCVLEKSAHLHQN